jgi:Glyoxalase/Bleomycin resistance protein/Dioxygenase superfamily
MEATERTAAVRVAKARALPDSRDRRMIAAMREPVFADTVQVALVVRDLQATMKIYVERYGIGPWDIYEFNPDTVEDMRSHGEPVESSWRLALARVGGVMWELIEPLDDRSTYAEFLAAHGEGVHHIGMAGAPFDGTLAEFESEGRVPLLSGRYGGVGFAYLPTDTDMRVATEIFSAVPSGQEPDARYPAA